MYRSYKSQQTLAELTSNPRMSVHFYKLAISIAHIIRNIFAVPHFCVLSP